MYLRARMPGHVRGLKRGRVVHVAETPDATRVYVEWETGTKSCLSSWRNLLVVLDGGQACAGDSSRSNATRSNTCA